MDASTVVAVRGFAVVDPLLLRFCSFRLLWRLDGVFVCGEDFLLRGSPSRFSFVLFSALFPCSSVRCAVGCGADDALCKIHGHHPISLQYIAFRHVTSYPLLPCLPATATLQDTKLTPPIFKCRKRWLGLENRIPTSPQH